MGVDVERIVSAAAQSYLQGGERQGDASSRRRGGRGFLGGTRGVAVGVGLGLAARAAYRRVRKLDLEQVAGSVESRLKR
jgi:hypothetical protein